MTNRQGVNQTPLFTLPELESARQLVHSFMPPTPQYAWPLLSQRAGCEVWVKHENHTPTGAFKVRGGINYLHALAQRDKMPAGLITATRGNHGQSIPYAASRYNLPVTVLVPEGNSMEKNLAMQAWGAELIVHGSDFDDARLEAERLANERQLEFVPSFHPALVTGVASYALEFFLAVKDLDTVYVPIGMGSGICALIGTRDLLGLNTEIVGVVSTEAPAYARSVENNDITITETAHTFADGVACRVPIPQAVAIIRQGASRIVEVTDDQIAQAMRDIYSDTHNVSEGAGASALAALKADPQRCTGGRVGIILTGGNIDADKFAAVLQGGTPSP